MAARSRSYVFQDEWGWRWHCVRCGTETTGPHGGVGWTESQDSARRGLQAHNRRMRGVGAHAPAVRRDFSGLPPWHRRPDARPVQIEEFTPEMLRPVQRWADRSRLPQTVWPSEYFGGEFVGDSDGLATVGKDFVAVWSMPSRTDQGNIYFRRLASSMSIES